MLSSISTFLRATFGQPPKLVCAASVWRSGTAELRRRAGGRRESGAFLLGQERGQTRRIEQFVFYDDLDPTCFRNGIVEFDGRRFGALWQLCRETGRTVVSDIHVHPAGCWQSGSDQHNPMIAEAGHLAIILPDYAAKRVMPGDIGVYEYRGSRQWLDHSPGGREIFHVGWWPW